MKTASSGKPRMAARSMKEGGGTVARYLAKTGMDIIDCGPPVLGMHSPLEVSSKDDLWMCHRAFKAFFSELRRVGKLSIKLLSGSGYIRELWFIIMKITITEYMRKSEQPH